MVSQSAVEAVRSEYRKSSRTGRLSKDLRWRRSQRQRLLPLLTPKALVSTRNGRTLAGLRDILRAPGGPSDSSRIVGRIHARPEHIRRWCERLLDRDSEPAVRLSGVDGPGAVAHLGRNAFSVLLHLQEPEDFGYVNGQVERALKAIGEWPRFPRGLGPGKRYLLVNSILNELATRAGLDALKTQRLAGLDQVLWYLLESAPPIVGRKKKGRLAPGDPDKDAELSALEGGKREIGPHLKTERNSALVAGLKRVRSQEYPDLECEVCGFSFVVAYGELGQDFIEAHHREVLARRKRRRSDGADFDFVCSNCHRMLHRMGLADMSTEGLRRLMATRRKEAHAAIERWWARRSR